MLAFKTNINRTMFNIDYFYMFMDMRYIPEIHIFNALKTVRTDRVGFLIKHRLTPFANIFYLINQTMSIKNQTIKNPREKIFAGIST